MEPILAPDDSRYVLFPIQHQDIYALYQSHVSCFWRAEEIDFKDDHKDWKSLTDNERYFIKQVLAFFAMSDGLVIENLAERFSCEVQLSEARQFYAFQSAMEAIHSETYSILIDTYVKNKKEREELFNAVKTCPAIKQKADWAKDYINGGHPFCVRLVAFAIIEGIFFSGSFCAIFWLKRRGLMSGLCTANEFISRDESLHTEHAVCLYHKLVNKMTDEDIETIIRQAVTIECNFINDALPCRLLGMNGKLMSQYIEFVADRLAVQLGSKKVYGSQNPFDFMEQISLEGKTNFFEKRVTEYALANTDGKDAFNFDTEF
jgi:ribonucleoside-diphosphate reductase beta chain